MDDVEVDDEDDAKKLSQMESNEPAEDYSKPGSLPFRKLWGPNVDYSDQLANGDRDDNKELEDEEDLADPIADDNGFVHKWKLDPRAVKEWGRRKDVH